MIRKVIINTFITNIIKYFSTNDLIERESVQFFHLIVFRWDYDDDGFAYNDDGFTNL